MVKNLSASAADMRDMSSISGSERSPGVGHGNSLQYSCWENSMDRGTWQATVYRIAKNWTQLKQPSMHAHIESVIWLAKGKSQKVNVKYSCIINL